MLAGTPLILLYPHNSIKNKNFCKALGYITIIDDLQ